MSEEKHWGDVWPDDWEWDYLEFSVTFLCACGEAVSLSSVDDTTGEPTTCACGRKYRVLATVEGLGHEVDGFHEATP